MATNIFCVRTRQGLYFNRRQLHHSFAKLFARAVILILAYWISECEESIQNKKLVTVVLQIINHLVNLITVTSSVRAVLEMTGTPHWEKNEPKWLPWKVILKIAIHCFSACVRKLVPAPRDMHFIDRWSTCNRYSCHLQNCTVREYRTPVSTNQGVLVV